MAFRGLIDVCLHFHSFRNVDLFHQGLYAIRARLYQDSSSENAALATAAAQAPQPVGTVAKPPARVGPPLTCVAACPYALVPSRLRSEDFAPCSSPAGSARTAGQHGAVPQRSSETRYNVVENAEIDHQKQTFRSRAFLVRYCDEEVQLNDVVVFRLEVNLCSPHALVAPVYLELDLLFADPLLQSAKESISINWPVINGSVVRSSGGVVDNSAAALNVSSRRNAPRSEDLFASRVKDTAGAKRATVVSPPIAATTHDTHSSDKPDSPEFISVAYQIFKLNNVAVGLHEYIPVTFDEFHFSLCSLTLHSTLVDLRSRLRPWPTTCGYIPRHLARRPPPSISYGKQGTEALVPTAYPPHSTLQEQNENEKNKQLPPFFPFEKFLLYGHKGLLGVTLGNVVRFSELKSADTTTASSSAFPGIVRTGSYDSELLSPLILSDHNKGEDTSSPDSNFMSDGVNGVSRKAILSDGFQNFSDNTTPTRDFNGLTEFTVRASPEMVLRASALHREYVKILLDSLLRLLCVYRAIAYRCFTPKQRLELKEVLQPDVIKLPGGETLALPGTASFEALFREKMVSKGSNGLSTPAEPLHCTPEITSRILTGKNTDTFLGGRSPRASKSQRVYNDDELLYVTAHLSPYAMDEEIARFLEETCALEDLKTPDVAVTESTFDKGNGFPSEVAGRMPKLTARVGSTPSLDAIAACMAEIMELWQRLTNTLPLINSEIETVLRYVNEHNTLRRWRQNVLREQTETDELVTTVDRPVWDAHNRSADTIRRSQCLDDAALPITDLFLIPPPDLQPIIFEQVYVPVTPKRDNNAQLIPPYLSALNNRLIGVPSCPKSYNGIHLFVLVHGFQGNSYDMRLIKNTLGLFFGDCMCLSSSANEENTEKGIDVMGKKLADEVIRYIDHWCGSDTLARLTFICHSLGGVIARAAFPHLKSLWPKFHSFVTLSSPHLGYMCNTNRLIDAAHLLPKIWGHLLGLWVLRKWRRALSLQQLTLTDAKTPEKAFLFNLCQDSEALGYFKYVCFVSSYQDQYVPFESARAELPSKAGDTNKLNPVYAQMARGLTKHIAVDRFLRLNVNFRITERSLDSMIGRAAHIQFLESHVLIRMFILVYAHIFQ